jgi:uncharacterized Tic20 family protein
MTEREKRFVEYWDKKRKSGFYKFSLFTGLIYAFFVIISAKILAWDFNFSKSDFLVVVTAILIGVLILGPFLWWNRERRYKKIMDKTTKNKPKRKKKR